MIPWIAAYVPHSPGARATLDLGLIATVVFTIIFVLVAGTIVYSLFRFRWREGEPDPKQLAGHKTVEIVWTAIPLVIVVFLFVLTARTMSKVDPPPPAEPDLVVTGHQWWWEARYPRSGVVVANEIHIPSGQADLGAAGVGRRAARVLGGGADAKNRRRFPASTRITSGCRRVEPAPISGSARNSAARSTPGCVSWSWRSRRRSLPTWEQAQTAAGGCSDSTRQRAAGARAVYRT